MPGERADGVWAAGSVDGGPPQKGIGVDMNQAFSVDVVFGLGWALVREHPAVVLGAASAIAVVQLGMQGVQQGGRLLMDGSDPVASLAFSLGSLVVGLVGALLIYWISAGLLDQVEVAARGGTPTLGGVLRSSRVANAIFAGLLCQVLLAVPTMLLLAPGVAAIVVGVVFLLGDPTLSLVLSVGGAGWVIGVAILVSLVGLFAMLVLPASVLSGGGPLDAISAAWDAASGARITLFVLALVTAIATFAGMLCCFFPVIGVIGVTNSGMGLAWLLYARPREETRTWPFFQEHASDLL